jgi:DNA-binding response OmpR family regulator
MSEVSEVPVVILVLEEDARTIHLIQVNLDRQGYQVEIVANSIEALVRMRSRRPALLIASEELLGEISARGSEFVRELRRDPSLADLPVIVLHTRREEGLSPCHIHWAYGKGMPLGKAFNPQELLSIIKYILSHPKEQIPKRIFVVEDDGKIMRLLYAFLAREGYAVRPFTDGTTALPWMRGDKPDLLITGDPCSGVAGAEFVALLRREPDLDDLPVILLRAQHQHDEGYTYGDAFGEGLSILKPFDPLEIMINVRRLLSQEKPHE